MRIAYFTSKTVQASETFFFSLIKGLESKVGANLFIHIVGVKKGTPVAQNTLFANFLFNNRLTKSINELEERLKLKTKLAIRIIQYYAIVKLNILKKEGLPDVAFIEYGTTAIKIYSFLAKNNIPFIVHFHGKDATAEFRSRTYTSEVIKIFKVSKFIVTPSYHLKRILVLKGCSPQKIHVIRHGLDLKNFVPLDWNERMKSGPSIVSLGRLTEKKHPIALIHAFSIVINKIPNAKLTIIGDGKLRKEVEQRISNLGLSDSIFLLGSLTQNKAHEILNKHWVFAQHNVTSIDGDQEGYSLAPLEAAAFEIPVVSTIHNGIPEHVIDGKTGYLVREFDYETMASKIISLLEDAALSRKFGQQGRLNAGKYNQPQPRIDAIYKLLEIASIS